MGVKPPWLDQNFFHHVIWPTLCTGSVFTSLHGMQTRSSDENSVCLSVCPSDTRVDCDKTEERSVQIFIPYERIFSLVFEKKNGWWGATPSR